MPSVFSSSSSSNGRAPGGGPEIGNAKPDMPWLEIPAHRVLALSRPEFLTDFELLDEDGAVVSHWQCEGQSWQLARRKRDQRLFRRPRLHGGLVMMCGGPGLDLIALEEL